MIITRWQAPVIPQPEQMKMIFQSQGLEGEEETYPAKSKVGEHRHPFDEVRMIVTGQMILEVSGNQVLLRPGDKVEIPSNTKHSTSVEGEEECKCIVANRAPR